MIIQDWCNSDILISKIFMIWQFATGADKNNTYLK